MPVLRRQLHGGRVRSRCVRCGAELAHALQRRAVVPHLHDLPPQPARHPAVLSLVELLLEGVDAVAADKGRPRGAEVRPALLVGLEPGEAEVEDRRRVLGELLQLEAALARLLRRLLDRLDRNIFFIISRGHKRIFYIKYFLNFI